jgi:copper chaperone CopZ
MKKTYKVEGMHCSSCAMMIEGELLDAGIKCKCSFAKQEMEVEEDTDEKKVIEIITPLGYKLSYDR